MHAPRPVDPLGRRRSCWITVRCPCGHSTTELVRAFMERTGVAGTVRFWQLESRLRCDVCHLRGKASIDVKLGARW